MTRAPASSLTAVCAEAQIDTAVLRLVDLFARQVAWELAVGAPEAEETPHAATAPQQD